MKLLLHENSLNIRGTSAAMFDYAINLKNLYNIECCITFDLNYSAINDSRIIEKFNKEFKVIGYNNFEEVNSIIKNNNIDAMYFQKAGFFDNKINSLVPNYIHCVFPIANNNEIHGDKFVFISEWLSNEHLSKTGLNLPFVPYMINLPQHTNNYRSKLQISKDKIVLGRYGGLDTFDIQYVKDGINEILLNNTDIVFLFCNTPKFTDHPNAIFLDSLANVSEKVSFLNTCDAFLHARSDGETFGLAILEAMSLSLPVITCREVPGKNHLLLLNNEGLFYSSKNEFKNIILNFKKQKINYNNLINYSPQAVTKKFVDTFLN